MKKNFFLSLFFLLLLLLGTADTNASTLSGMMALTDYNDPSSFGFSFSNAISPVSSPVNYFATLSVTMLDGGDDGVSFSPLAGDSFTAEYLLDGAIVTQLGPYNESDFSLSTSGIYTGGISPYSSMSICVDFLGSGYGDNYRIEVFWEVTGSPVPEPSTVFLLGFGLLGLASVSRKK